jgi:hypothetical protein
VFVHEVRHSRWARGVLGSVGRSDGVPMESGAEHWAWENAGTLFPSRKSLAGPSTTEAPALVPASSALATLQGLHELPVTLVRWHAAFCSASITRRIVTAAATPIVGAVARRLVEQSSGGCRAG